MGVDSGGVGGGGGSGGASSSPGQVELRLREQLKVAEGRIEELRKMAEESEKQLEAEKTENSRRAKTNEAQAMKIAVLEVANGDLATVNTEKEALVAALAKQHAALEDAATDKAAADHHAATLTATNLAQAAELDWQKEAASAADELRRQMHNTIQDLKGNIRVVCRVRPLLPHEEEAATSAAVAAAAAAQAAASSSIARRASMSSSSSFSSSSSSAASSALASTPASTPAPLVALNVPVGDVEQKRVKVVHNEIATHDFSFDRVFNQSAGQGDVFNEVGGLVQSVMDGFNA